jgi:hypothetical protein
VGQLVLPQSEGLPDEPAEAVSRDRAAERFRCDRHAEPGQPEVIGVDGDPEMAVPEAFAEGVELIEFRFAPQAPRGGKF